MRAAAGLLVLALVLAGCESNIERSADLAKLAHHKRGTLSALTITRASRYARVAQTAVVHSNEGTAAVVIVRNDSARALRDVPILIAVRDPAGGVVFQNNTRGLEAALTTVPFLPAHGEAAWIDDQVQASGTPASVSALLGEARATHTPPPQIEVQGVHASEEGGAPAAAGTVHNRSTVAQQSLVVYVLARRAGAIVAAGRAVVPEVAAGASAPFQAFLVGTPSGARLEASAPPTALG